MTTAGTNISSAAVSLEDDPTPFVLRVAHRMRLAAAEAGRRATIERLAAEHVTVAVAVADTPRKATLSFARAGVRVSHGVAVRRDLLLTLGDQPTMPVLSHESLTDSADLVNDITALLNPPIADWRTCAHAFWAATAACTGMPGSVEVLASDGAALTLGEPAPRYEIHGDADALARTFAGLDPFFDNVLSGALRVRGTMAQLSVMTAAFWKVQSDA